MNCWEHITQVPEDMRTTMSHAFILWEKQDLGIENIIDLTIQNAEVTQRICISARSAANCVRIPALVKIVHQSHPNHSLRDVFQAVALFTGLYNRHISRLYYADMRSKCSI